MGKDLLLRADGTAAGSLGSLSYCCAVNAGEDLMPGAACAAMLEATVYSSGAPVGQGESLDYYRDGVRMGRFFCEKPRRTGTDQFRITAYDAMIRFDRDADAFLESLSYPLTLGALLRSLCDFCGVPPAPEIALPNEDLPVEKFPGRGVTGRKLLGWIGQAAGRYFTVSPEGCLVPGWYSGEPVALGGGSRGLMLADGLLADRFFRPFAVRTALPYRLGSLTCGDYATAPVERVLIRAGASDVGAVWPDGSPEEANTLIIQGNPLLMPHQGLDLQAVARMLYEQLREISYTPFSCRLLPGSLLLPGTWVRFTDADGVMRTAPVMEMKLQNGSCTLTATGNPSLQSTTAFNSLTVEEVMGRVLTVERTADGLVVENSDLSGSLAQLKLSLDGIGTRVSAVETDAQGHATVTQVSQLEQRADALELVLSRMQEGEDGEEDEIRQCFLFDENGLTISNSATGMGIGISQERIVFTGGTDPTTQITPNEMRTTNLRVGSRLDLGVFSLIPRTNGNLSLRYTAGTGYS